MKHEPNPMMRKAQRALAMNGGLYDFEDILTEIEAGRMQSFSDGVNWIVTAIHVFPRKRVLDIVMVVGDLEGVTAMEPRIIEFAAEHQIDMLATFGARDGWEAYITAGWVRTSACYIKELR